MGVRGLRRCSALVGARPLPAAVARAIERAGGAPPRALGRRGASCTASPSLFSLDSFGGGFVVTALLVLWLQRRFDLSVAVSGAIFFWAGVLLGVLGTRRRAHRAPHRAGAHDGVHAPAGQRSAHPHRVHAERAARRGLPAGSFGAVADGRAGAHVVRDGGRHAGGASGRGQRDERAAQPRRRRCRRSLAGWMLGRIDVRLAAGDRRRGQGRSTTCCCCASSATCARPRRSHQPADVLVHLALTKQPAWCERGHRTGRADHRAGGAAPGVRLVACLRGSGLSLGEAMRGSATGVTTVSAARPDQHPGQSSRLLPVTLSGGPQRSGFPLPGRCGHIRVRPFVG